MARNFATILCMLTCAAAMVGCGTASPPSGIWTGYVVPQTLQTDPRGHAVLTYQAAALRVVEEPVMLAVDSANVDKSEKSAGTRILVNDQDRILDPAAFGSGLVHVEGTSTGLWGACDEQGHWLYYDPPRREVDWVREIIRVKRATDASGRELSLEVQAVRER
jgi:hypothetical protein